MRLEHNPDARDDRHQAAGGRLSPPEWPVGASRAERGSGGSQDDQRELRSLFEARYSAMVGLARLLVGDIESAEDVVQEAFARLSGRLQGVSNPEAYLCTMVVNRCRAAIRRRQTARRHAWRLLSRATPGDVGQSVADQQAISAALGRLPVRQRECLVLRYHLDWSEKQIADALGISTGSVKTHTSRALAGMNELLRECHD